MFQLSIQQKLMTDFDCQDEAMCLCSLCICCSVCCAQCDCQMATKDPNLKIAQLLGFGDRNYM